MSNAGATEPGLRERKRRATRRAIQLAALQLIRENGLDGLTVDAVSRIADISPRTFFNYFASKEEAVVGDGPQLPSPELVEWFVADREQDVLSGIGTLLLATAEAGLHDHEIVLLRKELVHQHPHLTTMRMREFRLFEEDFAEIVARRLAAEDPELAADPNALTSRARLVTYVAMAAMRHAWSCWAASDEPGSQLSDRLRSSFEELETVLPRVSAR